MKQYSIGQFAKKIGKSPDTIRRWHREGHLVPEFINERTGHRYYSERQVKEYFGDSSGDNRIVVGYCRVSSQKQKEALLRQVDNVEKYLLSQGCKFKIIKDIGSGINYDKKGLNELIRMIMNDEVSKVVVLYKDRLVRFGFELIQNICELKSVKLEVIDNTEKTDEEEVVEDLVQIITVFSCRLQGKRNKKTKQMIRELTSDD